MDPLRRFFEPRSEAAYALLRVIAGITFGFFGMQKILGILSTFKPEFGTQIWWGGLIELVCGILIALGLFTRWASFLASGTMAVAYAQFHWKFAFDEKFFPAINEGGPALLYCVVFFYFACRGGGRWSLDSRSAVA